MSINVEAVKPNYRNVRYTAKGNQYRKTNIGKIAGAAGATLVSSVSLIKNRSFIKNVLAQVCDGAQNALQQRGFVIDPKQLTSAATRGLRIGGAIGLGISALVGLGIGGLGDFIANKIKAHKADKENTGTIV